MKFVCIVFELGDKMLTLPSMENLKGQCNLNLSAGVPDATNQRTNGPINAHLISWPSKAQNIQNLENIW